MNSREREALFDEELFVIYCFLILFPISPITALVLFVLFVICVLIDFY
jgi:hypothetical protein